MIGRGALKREAARVDRRIDGNRQAAGLAVSHLSARALNFIASPAALPAALAAGFMAERLRRPALRLSGSLIAALPALLRFRHAFRQLQRLAR